ncbi:MAG: manganese efflux pump MntP family protein [Kiritimatiellia bacterium]
MKFLEVVTIAIGLSMDACAIAIAGGYAIRRLHMAYALRMALAFGFFQMLMPLVGWSAGHGVRGWITAIDHWIVFGVLAGTGCKMIYEAVKIEKAERGHQGMGLRMLLILAIATSLDALAVGFSLSLLDVAIVTPAIIIGIITFIMTLAGAYIGNHFGHCFENRIEIAGGVILIALGLRILLQHL